MYGLYNYMYRTVMVGIMFDPGLDWLEGVAISYKESFNSKTVWQ